MVQGPLKSWHHVHRFEETPQGDTLVRDDITYRLPVLPHHRTGPGVPGMIANRLERVFRYRNRQLADDLAFHAAHPGPRTIAVTGSTGLVGTQLVALLQAGGHTVRRIRRGEAAPGEILWDPAGGDLDPEDLREVDAVIHLAGESLFGPMTGARKRRIMESRRDGTLLVARALAAIADDNRPRALISASAAGWYGPDPGNHKLTEDMPAGEGFLAQVCQEWEAACQPAREAGVRVVNVRSGIIQSAAGGQLAVQLPLFLAGVGGPLGSGKQWMPWISIDDLVAIFAHAALQENVQGPVNAVAPGIVRNQDYARTLGAVLGRPAAIRVPRLGPALLLGKEGADEFALAGQRMSAQKIADSGYAFRFPDLSEALAHQLLR